MVSPLRLLMIVDCSGWWACESSLVWVKSEANNTCGLYTLYFVSRQRYTLETDWWQAQLKHIVFLPTACQNLVLQQCATSGTDWDSLGGTARVHRDRPALAWRPWIFNTKELLVGFIHLLLLVRFGRDDFAVTSKPTTREPSDILRAELMVFLTITLRPPRNTLDRLSKPLVVPQREAKNWNSTHSGLVLHPMVMYVLSWMSWVSYCPQYASIIQHQVFFPLSQ